MTIAKWEETLKELPTDELKGLETAFQTLQKCTAIRKQYKPTGIFTVAKLISFELDHRG